jgi:hypothetical protein
VKYSIQTDSYKKTLRFYGDEINYEYDSKYAPKPDVILDKGERARKILETFRKENLNNAIFRKMFQIEEMEETLEFYADINRYQHAKLKDTEIMKDNGDKARKCLYK